MSCDLDLLDLNKSHLDFWKFDLESVIKKVRDQNCEVIFWRQAFYFRTRSRKDLSKSWSWKMAFDQEKSTIILKNRSEISKNDDINSDKASQKTPPTNISETPTIKITQNPHFTHCTPYIYSRSKIWSSRLSLLKITQT